VGQIEVTRTYLQLTEPGRLVGAPAPALPVRIERVLQCPASFFRYLYAEVGRAYHWVDRARWTDDEIRAYLAQPAVGLWVMWGEGAPAGYYELMRHPDGAIEIAYFGLLPEFHGQGLGKYLLTAAVEEAWRLGASRVWLHTCTLDDPAALPNYRARGFEAFETETYWTENA
jgi:GNAT superfamily N-acetyltransferase